MRSKAPVITTVVVIAMIVYAALGGLGRGSRGNEGLFLRYSAATSGTPEQIHADHHWIKTHPFKVIDEGNRACSWLVQQPVAPATDPTGKFSIRTLGHRYVNQTRDRRIADVAPVNRWQITVEAWTHLCPLTSAPHIVERQGDG
jgi:flagellin-like protein